jgi:high-affinity nickel-transport protein
MADMRLSTRGSDDVEMDNASFFKAWTNKASTYHSRLPYIRKLPFPAIAIIITLILVNLLVWVAVAIVLVCRPATRLTGKIY